MGFRMGEPGLDRPLRQKLNQPPGVMQVLLWWALASTGSQSCARRSPGLHPTTTLLVLSSHIICPSCWTTAMGHPSKTTPVHAQRLCNAAL